MQSLATKAVLALNVKSFILATYLSAGDLKETWVKASSKHSKKSKGKVPVNILNKKALDCNPQLSCISLEANTAMCYTQNQYECV